MSGDEDTDKWARKFIREADDFVAGKRRKYPMELGRPLYVDPKRWPHKIKNGSKVSSLKGRGGNVSPSLTREQRKYRHRIDREIESNWTLLFGLFSINRKESAPAAYWKQMALELAERHVPSFGTTNQPPKRKRLQPGAPPKHSLDKDADFVIRIRNLQAGLKKKGLPCSIEAAANAWRQSEPDRWKTEKGLMSSKSIASRFGEARKRLAAEHIKGGMSLAALAALLPGP